MNNKKRFAYDLPTRLFHFLFGSFFLTAFFIAKNIDDDSLLFPLHMLIGLTLLLVVLCRIYWGFAGSRYARFSSFLLNPKTLFQYSRAALLSKTPRHLAHNPATSWVAILMMLLAVGLAISGTLMTSGFKADVEDFHEWMANGFIILVIMHVLGIAWHTFRHKEVIGLSMITGNKISDALESEEAPITNSHPWMALVFAVLVGLYAGYLYKSYDPLTGKLHVFGQTLQLGEDQTKEQSDE